MHMISCKNLRLTIFNTFRSQSKEIMNELRIYISNLSTEY